MGTSVYPVVDYVGLRSIGGLLVVESIKLLMLNVFDGAVPSVGMKRGTFLGKSLCGRWVLVLA